MESEASNIRYLDPLGGAWSVEECNAEPKDGPVALPELPLTRKACLGVCE